MISDQADRLSRMVQQLLLVGRLESQPLRPTVDVLAIAPRIQRAWDALAIADRRLTLRDDAPGWLAVADGDQLDQVLWALLDNAVKYGEGAVAVTIGADPAERTLWTTIADEGAASTRAIERGCSGASSAAPPAGPAATAAASACTCRAR